MKLIKSTFRSSVVLITLSILFLILSACNNSHSTDKSYIPKQAYDIVDIGNGWSTFKLKNMEFLYHNCVVGYSRFECITRIK